MTNDVLKRLAEADQAFIEAGDAMEAQQTIVSRAFAVYSKENGKLQDLILKYNAARQLWLGIKGESEKS